MVRAAVRPVVVTGVLVVHDGARWLKECLDALVHQTRPLDRLVIVDTGSTDESLQIAQRHAGIRQVVGDVALISAPHQSSFGDAVRRAAEKVPPGLASTAPATSGLTATNPQWLWLLHDDSAAHPQALAHLLDAARRSPSVGVAGPKLVTWEDPSRLLEVGSLITRSGRRVGRPSAGEPDQGQHDQRQDVLGVSTSGMLIRRDVFESLRGFDPAFRQFRDDLDLCWRAQLAGYRVVVAPKARMREAAAAIHGLRSPGESAAAARRRDRRHGRQVALARCSLLTAPLLAIWIVLVSLASAALLLVAKRPRGAVAYLADLGALVTPWRPMAARWRAHGIRRVRRRDLRGLFASPKVGFSHVLETVRDTVTIGSTRSSETSVGSQLAVESGPSTDDAEPPELSTRWVGWRILGHPGFLAVMVGALLAAVTWRSWFGAVVTSGRGIAGGELLPLSSNASALWHAWLDGWHGAGLGGGLEPAPYLPVLSAAAWLLEHLPLVGGSTSRGLPWSSVGASIAWLMAAAAPLSAWTAYLAARVVTRAPWPRAWAALAWASLATMTTAVASGRLGAVVAHILLPLVAAGFVCAARPSARSRATFGAAVALGVGGVFNPVLGAVGALAALVLLVVGHGRVRLRALVLLLVPIGLLGPWILRVVDNPLLVLSGPGLTVWRGATPAPWRLVLLQPGGPGSLPLLASVPIVMVGLIALARRDADRPMMTLLAVLAACGLMLGVGSAHVTIGLVPKGQVGAGGPITGWAGTGLDLAALALIAAALHGFARSAGPLSLPRWQWRRILVVSVAGAAVLGVAASVALAGWFGSGPSLVPAQPNTPAVAADQAHGLLSSRLLAVTRHGDTIDYQLVGAEPGSVARDLPGPSDAPDPLLAAAVTSVVGAADGTSSNAARHDLADLGIGFVAFRGPASDPLVNQLDSTGGLTRLGNNGGLVLWRVLPGASSVSPSRLRFVDATGAPLASVGVSGDHGQAAVAIGPARPGSPAGGRRLVVAEPNPWATRAQVTYAGHRLVAVPGAAQPTYLVPPQAGQLTITLPPTHQWWRWGQLALLLAVLFLAAPFGSTLPNRTP